MNQDLEVLLLDDSAAERELVLEAAHEFGQGINLRVVSSLEDAEAACRLCMPAVILIDLHLGRWHGRDLLPKLRGSIGNVILTNTADAAEEARCRAAGALAFWVKPLQFAGFASLFVALRRLGSRGSPHLDDPLG
jgi:CheY-like chemotaxis protein